MVTPEPALSATESGLHLVVFLEESQLAPPGRERLFRDLPDFVQRQAAAGASVLLISSDRGGTVGYRFSRDPQELAAIVEELSRPHPSGLPAEAVYKRAVASIYDVYSACQGRRGSPCDDCFEAMRGIAASHATSVLSESRSSLAVLDRLVGVLGALEGRKVLLYLSDGLEEQPGIGAFQYLEDLCPGRGAMRDVEMQHPVLTPLATLTARANANRVTLYSVEAAGLRVSSHASAESGLRIPTAEASWTFSSPSAKSDWLHTGSLQNTLTALAVDTGGKAILNTNRFAPALSDLSSELATYYSLGFDPGHLPEGRTHRIQLELPGRGVTLRYRRSYLHRDLPEKIEEKTRGAFLFGVADNPLEAQVVPGPASVGRDGRIEVPLEFRIPLERLTLIPMGDERHGRLRLLVAAPKPDSRESSMRLLAIPVRLPLNPPSGGETDYRFGIRLHLAPGEQSVAVGIWDEISATASFLTAHLDVPSAPPGTAAATPAEPQPPE